MWVDVVSITLPRRESSRESKLNKLVFPPLPMTEVIPLCIFKIFAGEGGEFTVVREGIAVFAFIILNSFKGNSYTFAYSFAKKLCSSWDL